MRCLGCPEDRQHDGQKLTLFHKLLLCSGCHAMATQAERQLEKARDQAHERSMQWLEQHIMKGGLHRGGPGTETDGT